MADDPKKKQDDEKTLSGTLARYFGEEEKFDDRDIELAKVHARRDSRRRGGHHLGESIARFEKKKKEDK